MAPLSNDELASLLEGATVSLSPVDIKKHQIALSSLGAKATGIKALDLVAVACRMDNLAAHEWVTQVIRAKQPEVPATDNAEVVQRLAAAAVLKHVDAKGGKHVAMALAVRSAAFPPSMTRPTCLSRFNPRRIVSVGEPPGGGSITTSSQPSASNSDTRSPDDSAVTYSASSRSPRIASRNVSASAGVIDRPSGRSTCTGFASDATLRLTIPSTSAHRIARRRIERASRREFWL